MQTDLFTLSQHPEQARHISESAFSIDPRYIAHIEPLHYYSPKEMATLLQCSPSLIWELCGRAKPTQKPDPRFIQDIRDQQKFTRDELATRFGCSYSHIRNMIESQQLKTAPIYKSSRVIGWSLKDYIHSHVFSCTHLTFLRLGNLIKIPGWSIQTFVYRNLINSRHK